MKKIQIFWQVNCALSLNRTRNQWVDLGIHTETCITRPETCGAAGGAISLWINVIDGSWCSGGIVSSSSFDGRRLRRASRIYCSYYIKFDMFYPI